jgi:hypothetical protein
MIGRLALVLGLGIVGVGCNQVFNLDKTVPAPGGDDDGGGDGGILIDLDLDGIPDDQDPCLAAAMDATQDEDMDGIANAADPCPLDDTTQTPLDGDGDLIPDTCDPFPATGGDTKRCTMTFNNTDLNLRLWHESDALMKWGTMQGNLHTVDGQGMTNVVSAIRIDGSAQPSYDVELNANGDSAVFHTVRLWARAADPHTNADVGCEISGNASSVRLAVVLGDGRDFGAQSLFEAFPLGIDLRIQMSVGPDSLSPNVRCSFAWQFQRHTVKAPMVLPVGQVGFGTEDTQVAITGLVIYDRDDVRPYP